MQNCGKLQEERRPEREIERERGRDGEDPINLCGFERRGAVSEEADSHLQ